VVLGGEEAFVGGWFVVSVPGATRLRVTCLFAWREGI
jgi:hypothetical protein